MNYTSVEIAPLYPLQSQFKESQIAFIWELCRREKQLLQMLEFQSYPKRKLSLLFFRKLLQIPWTLFRAWCYCTNNL